MPNMCYALLFFAFVGASAAPGDAEATFLKYSLESLKRMVYVRGLVCWNCTDEEYRVMARENAALPIHEHLAEEYDEALEYGAKVKKVNMSKVDFIHQMSTTDEEIDEARAERMWQHFSSQLESGSIDFLENGTMVLSLPVTHQIAPYMYDGMSDVIEGSFLAMRSVYMRLPRRYRRRLEARLAWIIDIGAVHALLVLVVSLLIIDMGISAASTVKRSDPRV